MSSHDKLRRFQSSFRTFCLGVIGFTNPPIGKALVASSGKKLFRAFGIRNLQCGATIVAEVESREVAVKMGFAAMLIDADHAALEDREHAFDGVRLPAWWLPALDTRMAVEAAWKNVVPKTRPDALT